MDEQLSERIVRLAAGRWPAIFGRLAPVELGEAMHRAPRHVRCPVHGGVHNDGFRLFRNYPETGGGICNTCGGHSNGISLLAWLKGMSYADTLRALLDELEGQGASLPPPPRKSGAELERERQARLEEDRALANRIRRVWRSALPLDDRRAEPARLYFARRGLRVYHKPRVLRLHPALEYSEDRKVVARFPALVFRVSDERNCSVTLHRIYLDHEGRKAPVVEPKKLMAYPSGFRTLTGGAIRLTAAGRTLGIAEGPETALAIIEATGMPVWSAIFTTLMRRVQLPKQVSRVIAWMDKDANGAGRLAGQALCERMWSEGRRAGAVAPPLAVKPGSGSADWLDVWNRLGRAGFPEWLRDPDSDFRRAVS